MAAVGGIASRRFSGRCLPVVLKAMVTIMAFEVRHHLIVYKIKTRCANTYWRRVLEYDVKVSEDTAAERLEGFVEWARNKRTLMNRFDKFFAIPWAGQSRRWAVGRVDSQN